MTPDQRRRHKLWRFSTWQWAVLGSYLVAVVLSFLVGRAGNTALDNTDRIDKALCAQIEYLESQAAVAINPDSRDNILTLSRSLRPLVPSCPAAPS